MASNKVVSLLPEELICDPCAEFPVSLLLLVMREIILPDVSDIMEEDTNELPWLWPSPV